MAIGFRIINGDGWLNLPNRRFNPDQPAQHFYLNAFRFQEMFRQLILPLRDHRAIITEVDFVEETVVDKVLMVEVGEDTVAAPSS